MHGQQTHGPAPSARPAVTYSRSRSDATMPRTPRATMGQPTSAKMPASSTNTVARRQHQRHHGAQREHDVDRRQHEHEIRETREELVDGAARVAGDAADAAPKSIAASVERTARPSEARDAVEQPREDVATVRIGAKQQQRRPLVSRW